MRGGLRILLALLLLPAVVAAAGESPAPAAPRLRSVQADFTQEKHLKILARPLLSNGRFFFQAPQSLRWEYTAPVPSILLLHNGSMKKFVRREGRLVEDADQGLDAMQFVLTEISGWLDGRFVDNEVFSVTRPDEETVVLTPKGSGMTAVISGIELKLSDRAGLLDRVTIFEGPDSRTVMTFSQRVLNEEIPAASFMTP
ncbi:MAG: hypothetical protein BWK76_25765 [Desulfobulbaceae bacterium A2]|nr:MAG: hypothetical protein BWK76_25765 [Desulfobulbaceae bacterium A2]